MGSLIRSWSEIRKHYARLNRPDMSELVETIEASPYAAGLYPWTSMWTLCLSQTYVDFPCPGPYLTIEPVATREIEFRYIDTYYLHKQWRRRVDNNDAFGRLERFFKELNWFTHYAEVTNSERREETQ